MIVTIRGAYRNAGDHLIGRRAHTLLSQHVDPDIVSIDRKAITDDSYEVMNQARAVLLTGGPAYQRRLHPDVYPLELDRIQVPVVPYGLGWKGNLGDTPERFSFTPESIAFLRRIHDEPTRMSSARCGLTEEVLRHNGVSNVLMTGCPAWYNEAKLDADYVFPHQVKRLVITAPANPRADTIGLARYLADRFPRAERYLAYQSGYRSPRHTYTALQLSTIARASMLGYRPVSFQGNVDRLSSFLSGVDLHVGYRVHSHLYSLSERITSVLFAEDSRAVGQAAALGTIAVASTATLDEKTAEIDRILESKGENVAHAVDRIRETYPVMRQFLSQL